MTLSQIEILVELSNERSFSRVAEKLGITQPAVSLAVKKFETELDTIIVSREKKSFELTEIGHNILIYCKQIAKQTRNIRSEVLSSKLGTKGKLILGTVWSVNNTLLPKIINTDSQVSSPLKVTIPDFGAILILQIEEIDDLWIAIERRYINSPRKCSSSPS